MLSPSGHSTESGVGQKSLQSPIKSQPQTCNGMEQATHQPVFYTELRQSTGMPVSPGQERRLQRGEQAEMLAATMKTLLSLLGEGHTNLTSSAAANCELTLLIM